MAAETTQPADGAPSLQRLLRLAVRHGLVLHAGAVAVPLTIGRSLKLPPEPVAFLIGADLFAGGPATLVRFNSIASAKQASAGAAATVAAADHARGPARIVIAGSATTRQSSPRGRMDLVAVLAMAGTIGVPIRIERPRRKRTGKQTWRW